MRPLRWLGSAYGGHLGLIYLATAIFVIGAVVALKPVLAGQRGPGGE
ncbi:hypothetical protein [Kribbella sp. NPDC050470]